MVGVPTATDDSRINGALISLRSHYCNSYFVRLLQWNLPDKAS